MAFTDADEARLREALAHGEQSVTHGDQTTTNRSITELLTAYDRIRSERSRESGRSAISYRRLTGGFER